MPFNWHRRAVRSIGRVFSPVEHVRPVGRQRSSNKLISAAAITLLIVRLAFGIVTGSRYGRRSNWFKIHCLIQDQAEMANQRLAEGQSPFTENKDLVTQYKPDRPTSRTTNHSSNGASPSSRHSSDGRAVPSPYQSLFEAAKASGFAGRFDSASPSDHHKKRDPEPKDPLQLAAAAGLGQLSPGSAFPFQGMPLSPVSPLSPLTAASRFFFHHPSASLFKGLHNLPKLYSGDLMANYAAAYQSRFMPAMHALNPVLKSEKMVKSEGVASTASPSSSEMLAQVAEQDGPIDLSVKSNSELRLSPSPPPRTKQVTTGDGDSGFSPSSNEEVVNTSPLDLTSKRTPEPSAGTDVDEDQDQDIDVSDVDDDRTDSPASNK